MAQWFECMLNAVHIKGNMQRIGLEQETNLKG